MAEAASASLKKSTNVRTVIRALGALAGLSPRAAVGLATRLFFLAPPRLRVRPEEAAVLARARRGQLRVGGNTLPTWRWGEGRPVLLLHGWGGRAAQLAGFVSPLVEAGFSPVAIDAPAHGGSGGRFASIPTFAHALLALADTLDRPAGLIAHSLGAAAGGLALARGLAPDRVVWLAPSAWPGRYFDQFMAAIGLDEARRAFARAEVEARLGVGFDQIELPRLPVERHRPALILHDVADREVPFSHGAAIAAAWPGAELLATQNLGHRRILSDADVIARSVRFLGPAAARCVGCGAASAEPWCETCALESHLRAPHARAA